MEKTINPKRVDITINQLRFYKSGDIIYPGALIRKTNLSMKNVYILLESIESIGLIERNFEVFCPKCKRYTGDVYETLNQIPNELFCGECGNELGIDPLDNTIVVYKVLVDK
ncbi:hypothetical protein [Alkalihalophilus marmarensis]|uniref:hypothetical protein n=1 Tax=Alkalihalophilus marmarensis TaxID=521377 RepID=UPI002E23E667|nr:hypothetical protein [Alkalihalophilus marmarensis]